VEGTEYDTARQVRSHDAFTNARTFNRARFGKGVEVPPEVREKATLKAIELIKAGIARAWLLEDVPTKTVPVEPSALVVGGGIAGLSTAIDLGDAGYKVYLVEKNTTIGGRMSQLDRTFPTDDCSI